MTTDDSRRVAIIGCGYLGRELGRILASRGHRVMATTTTPARLPELEAAGMDARRIVSSDLAGIAGLMADCDVVYLTLAAGRRSTSYREIYLAAAQNVVRAFPASPVTRVIYTSSTAVYAQDDGNWVDEFSPTEPTSENARALVETERALLDGAPVGIQVSVVRLGGIYGPGRSMLDFAERFAGQERSDGDVFLNLVHVDDVVAALVRLLDVPHHGQLNLVADHPTTRRTVFDPLLAAHGLPPVRWTSDPHAGRGKRVRNGRIKELLGLRLRHPRYVPELLS
jgi:nucleoside-diphosphate-sugar epimerase